MISWNVRMLGRRWCVAAYMCTACCSSDRCYNAVWQSSTLYDNTKLAGVLASKMLPLMLHPGLVPWGGLSWVLTNYDFTGKRHGFYRIDAAENAFHNKLYLYLYIRLMYFCIYFCSNENCNCNNNYLTVESVDSLYEQITFSKLSYWERFFFFLCLNNVFSLFSVWVTVW